MKLSAEQAVFGEVLKKSKHTSFERIQFSFTYLKYTGIYIHNLNGKVKK